MDKQEEHLDFRNKIKLNIAYYRKLKKFTQEQLAERIEVHPNYISALESVNSKSMPSFDLLYDIAKQLDIPPHKLLEIK